MHSEYGPTVHVGQEARLPVSSLMPRFEAPNRHTSLKLKTHSALTREDHCWLFILAWTF